MPWTGKQDRSGLQAQREYPEEISKQQIAEEIPQQRKRAAQKFQNKDMLKIHFHTYRHWHATMLQRQTRDKGFVQMMLDTSIPSQQTNTSTWQKRTLTQQMTNTKQEMQTR